MIVKFEISRRARRQIDKIDAWWTGNRPSTHSKFSDELDRAERLLRENPEIGIVCAVDRNGNIRRILLSETEYHVYYRYRADRDEIIVLHVWGLLAVAARGSERQLTAEEIQRLGQRLGT